MIGSQIVYWKLSNLDFLKYNSNGASKGNPEPSSRAFCTSNDVLSLFYAEGRRLVDDSNLLDEILALNMDLKC